MRTSVFLTIGFCHRWCGSQKQNFTPPKAFATLALPGELLGATRCHRLERNPLKDAELGSAHALAAHEQPQGALGQTYRHAEVGPMTVSFAYLPRQKRSEGLP
jgi:hypothetical protein